MKKCNRCGEEKDFSHFHRNVKKPDGYQYYCKECAKDYYRSWSQQSEGRQLRHAQWKAERRDENRARLREILESSKCADCGLSDFRVLEFDHVRGKKSWGVHTMAARGASWELILAEIAKCEVRCCNCHRIATGERSGWWTSRGERP